MFNLTYSYGNENGNDGRIRTIQDLVVPDRTVSYEFNPPVTRRTEALSHELSSFRDRLRVSFARRAISYEFNELMALHASFILLA